MRSSIRGLCAIFGSALIAFSLCGSTWRPHIHTEHSSRKERALFEAGRRLYQAGEFARASSAFQSAALQSERDRSPGRAAMNWSNAGGAELAHVNYRAALPFFLKGREIAGISGLVEPALARMGRFDEAEPVYRQAIEAVSAGDDLESTARVLSDFGITGLTGLIRAWMAAGARSVVATRWDVTDDDAASLMTGFYRALRAQPQMGAAFALQQAQEKFWKGFAHGQTSDRAPAVWGAWFVVGRE